MKNAIEKIESCGFECEAGPLDKSNDWGKLKETAEGLELGVPQALFEVPAAAGLVGRWFDVSLDGQRFLAVQQVGEPEEVAQTPVTVVQNWFAEFKEK